MSQQIRFLQVAKSCCRKKTVVLLFATKFVHVERSYRPKENLFNFSASDVAPVYGVTPAKFPPIRIQYSHNSQQPEFNEFVARQVWADWARVVKRATPLFNSFCFNVSKRVALSLQSRRFLTKTRRYIDRGRHLEKQRKRLTSPLKSLFDSSQLSGKINVQDGGTTSFLKTIHGSRSKIRLLCRLVALFCCPFYLSLINTRWPYTRRFAQLQL